MARCLVYPVAVTVAPGYAWRWRTIDGGTASLSKHHFLFFYDCMRDAQERGHSVDLNATINAARRFAGEPVEVEAESPAAERQPDLLHDPVT